MTIYPANASEITSIIGSPPQSLNGLYPVPITNSASRVFGEMVSNYHLEDLYQACLPIDRLIPVLHEIVTYGYESEELKKVGYTFVPGEYRQIEVTCGDYYPPLSNDVPELMKLFCWKLEELISSMSIPANSSLEQAITAFAGATLTAIHPFADGNGRTSRALMDYIEYYIKRSDGLLPNDIDVYQGGMIRRGRLDRVSVRDPYVANSAKILADYYYGYAKGRFLNKTPKEIELELQGEGLEFVYFNALSARMKAIIAGVSPRTLNSSPWKENAKAFANRKNLFDGKQQTIPIILSRYIAGDRKRRTDYT